MDLLAYQILQHHPLSQILCASILSQFLRYNNHVIRLAIGSSDDDGGTLLVVVLVMIDLDQGHLSLVFDQELSKRASLGDTVEGVVLSEHDI